MKAYYVNVKTQEEYKKEIGIMFTKKDLEIGMLVETRNGNKYIVMPEERLLGIEGKGNLRVYQYNENLIMRSENNMFDIVKIYDYYKSNFDFECKYRKLLWERKETPEYTMEELREKFVKHDFKIKEK